MMAFSFSVSVRVVFWGALILLCSNQFSFADEPATQPTAPLFFSLVDGNLISASDQLDFPVCAYLRDNLNAFPNQALQEDWPVAPQFSEITFPEWYNDSITDHLDIIRHIYLRVADRIYVQGAESHNAATIAEANKMAVDGLKSMQETLVNPDFRIQEAKFDIDNDGSIDQVYRIGSVPLNFADYAVDYPPEIVRVHKDDYLGVATGARLFQYRGRTYVAHVSKKATGPAPERVSVSDILKQTDIWNKTHLSEICIMER